MWQISLLFDGIVTFMRGGPFFPHDLELFLIWFYAGFAPSVWMWLYVIALFSTRALLRANQS